MKLFLTYDKSLFLVNTYQALKVLNVDKDSSQDEIKTAYRKLALEHHPDKNKNKKEDTEFKKITEAYNHLKNYDYHKTSSTYQKPKSRPRPNYRKPWGAQREDEKPPEQDWSKFTRDFEEGDPDFWKEYERKFWEDYNAHVGADRKSYEQERPREPKEQPNLFVDVDKSKCIGCCSCEIIAPDVFQINKKSMSNPKSSVINQKGAGVNKIMNAAQTCPTKAISVDDIDTKTRMYPY